MKEKIKNLYATILFYLFRIFPLQNKIVFSCFYGENYEGNPKYISDYLLKKRKDIKQVWVNHTKNKFELDKSIEVVKWGSIKMIYELATAKVWIDTHNKPLWIKKRKKQFYLETWHGGLGMKKIEGDAEDKYTPTIVKSIKHNSKMADLFISNSRHLTNIYKRAFWYDGPILEVGFPKNDIFYAPKEKLENIRNKVLNQLNIPLNKKVVLYAPTFRNTQRLDVYDVDFKKLKENLEKKFQKEFVVLFRLHPRIRHLSKEFSKLYNGIIDASYYDNMQELIIATDVFITDYSSGIFDFASLRRPGFLYAKDIKEYEGERGLYFDLHNMPFPLAQNNDELEENILNFDNDKYIKNLEEFFIKMGLKDNANSVEKIAKVLEEYIDTGKCNLGGIEK
jgi:CDP-glycerol:poly(glycerophosphate) glycerophosphotransferase